jgi:hypothetical protein
VHRNILKLRKELEHPSACKPVIPKSTAKPVSKRSAKNGLTLEKKKPIIEGSTAQKMIPGSMRKDFYKRWLVRSIPLNPAIVNNSSPREVHTRETSGIRKEWARTVRARLALRGIIKTFVKYFLVPEIPSTPTHDPCAVLRARTPSHPSMSLIHKGQTNVIDYPHSKCRTKCP